MNTAKGIFLDAIDLPGSARSSLLDRACGDDAALRAEVEALLRAHETAAEFLAEPTTPPSMRTGDAPHLAPGREIGPYHIERELGEGGFGVVYLAEQTEPVRRRVALKVIKPGMDTRQVIRRFEAERQALAVMDHPAIARVYDAGTTADGLPFFVMEYVDGPPITRYADSARLSIRERLELFERVCHAVQHAHAKGVVHRDIKPSNVLIAVVDGKPEPRVIDFGIAKAVAGTLPGHTALTHAAQIVGTPQYMAPEQAAIDQTDVDTRADVYSLGVLLYELLTGVTPFEAERLKGAGVADLERIIREVDPARPSTRVIDLGDDGDPVARARRLDTHHLWRALRGELDWIVMRAMEKDRARRYPTAYALAADVERHLHHEPVEAGPPSRAYRLVKFARRNRIELTAAGVVVLAIVALAVGGLWFGLGERAARKAADRELAKSSALASFAQSVFTGVDPANARGADTTLLRSILADANTRVHEELSDQPEAAAEMLNTVGFAYLRLGAYEEAEANFRDAEDVAAGALGDEDDLTLTARVNVASVLMETHRFAEAEGVVKPVVAARRRRFGDDHPETMRSLSMLAYLDQQSGRWDEARAVLEPLFETRRRVLGPDHEDTLLTQNNLANVLTRVEDLPRARDLFEDVVRRQRAGVGEDHPRTLATMNNLADVYGDLGDRDRALAMLREILAIKRRILEPGHPSLVLSLNNLASSLIDAGEYDQARALLDEALPGARAAFGERHLRTAAVLNTVSRLEREAGRLAEAEEALSEAIAIFYEVAGPDHPNSLILVSNRAALRVSQEHFAEALGDTDAVLPAMSDAFGPTSGTTVSTVLTRAEALIGLERFDNAERALLDAHESVVADRGSDDPQAVRLSKALAELYDAWGRPDDAAEWRPAP